MDGSASSSGRIRAAPISERYQVVERLDEGGMAAIFRAVDREGHRWCALKVLLPQHRNNPALVARFASEARAMADLRHRNLIEVYDVQLEADPPFFAMELATGGTVMNWVDAHGAMPPRMATDVTIQLCKGLRAAHDKSIVHRDVKPHNVLVNRRGTIKLTDFGIARHDEGQGLTMDGAGMGTLGFIAPEQRDSASEVDPRADIYSTGATLHTLLTGRTLANLYMADKQPEMLEGIPQALHGPIIKATRYRPDDRYNDVQELAKALFDAKAELDDDPEHTPPLATTEPSDHTDEIERFVSNPAAAERVRDPALQTDETPTGSIPSIDRGSLLRPQEEITRARQLQLINLKNLALGSLPLWALFFVLSVLILFRGTAITRSTEALHAAQARMDQTIAAEAPLVTELSRLGADEPRLRQLWAAVENSTGRERVQNLNTLALFAGQQSAAHKPEVGSSLVHVALEAEQRVKRLKGAVADVQRVEVWDQELRGDAIAVLAVRVGVAPPAER